MCTVLLPPGGYPIAVNQCIVIYHIIFLLEIFAGPQWPRGLRRRSAADRLLRLWVAWMSVWCKCCVLSQFNDELITRPEESYRLWCVVACDLQLSLLRRPWPIGGGGGAVAPKKQTNEKFNVFIFALIVTFPRCIYLPALVVCLKTHTGSVCTGVPVSNRTHFR
jgi:hypothetical protein